MVEATGLTVIDESVGAFTTTVPDPNTLPKYADTVTEPCLRAVKRPWLFTVATVASEVYQVACAVRGCVELSEYTPVAASCSVSPDAIEGEGTPTLIEVSTDDVTVTLAVPVTELIVAVTVVVPAFRDV